MFKPLENCLTYSASPKGWLYVKVFQIEAGCPREGGEIVKEESEGYGFAVQFPEQGFRRGLLAKKGVYEIVPQWPHIGGAGFRARLIREPCQEWP